MSKSDAQRALVLEHLTGRGGGAESLLDRTEPPNDIRVLRQGLAALRTDRPAEIDCADGGTPYRLLLGQAAVQPGARAIFRGTERLGERPHGDLIDSLREALGGAGLEIREGSPWPVEVRGIDRRAERPEFRIRARESSQFPSSLLLASASLSLREGREWAVALEGPVASPGYLSLTVDWIRRWGFSLDEGPERLVIRGYRAPETTPPVPGDWSSIAYLLLLAWRSGGLVGGVDPEAAHPDRAVVRILARAGIRLEARGGGRVAVLGAPRSGIEASGAESPDLLPTMAALACVLPGPSVLQEVGILRNKESDRLEAIVEMARAAGAAVDGDDRALRISPGAVPPELRIPSRKDHRVAMSAAVLSALSGSRVWIDRPECVGKSFPGFWTECGAAGLDLRLERGGAR